VASLAAEVERLRAEVERLRRERDRSQSLLEEAQHREAVLREVTHHLARGTDIDELASNVLALVVPRARADAGGIALWENGALLLHCTLAGGEQAQDEEGIQGLLQGPWAQWASEQEEVALIADASSDERWADWVGVLHGICSALAVPLRRDGRLRGLLLLLHHDPHHFHQEEGMFWRSVMDQTAIALENALLLEKTRQRVSQLYLLNQISHDVSAILDEDALLWRVVRLIRDTLDCHYVAIALVEGEELVFRAGVDRADRPTTPTRLSLQGQDRGIAAWVARTGQPLRVSDIRQDQRYMALPGLSDVRSVLAVPLRSRAQGQEPEGPVIGVLDVRSSEVDAFAADDQEVLEALAIQVAVAIEGARLFASVHDERAALQAIINGTSDAIVVTDMADRVLFLNPAARDAFANGSPPHPGTPFAQAAIHPALLAFWQSASTWKGRSPEITVPDGRTFNASLTEVEGVGKVAIMHDITQLKEMDQVKSEFISTVSHDLRSPLQVIQNSGELLLRMEELTAEQRKEVERILAIVRRMSTLVRNLLDIGRIEAGIGMEIQPCAVDEIIASSAGAFRGLAQRRGLDFTVDVPRTLPLVRGNPTRLDQVVSNLVSNAIKFTPEGSITVRAWTENGEVILEVSDTGIGIPPEDQEALFQKFYRVRNPRARGIQGTGLGLAIAKSIVESYGGRIEVESVPRLGSTFRVVLPVYEAGPD
jgi:signal transduction histidine kinase